MLLKNPKTPFEFEHLRSLLLAIEHEGNSPASARGRFWLVARSSRGFDIILVSTFLTCAVRFPQQSQCPLGDAHSSPSLCTSLLSASSTPAAKRTLYSIDVKPGANPEMTMRSLTLQMKRDRVFEFLK